MGGEPSALIASRGKPPRVLGDANAITKIQITTRTKIANATPIKNVNSPLVKGPPSIKTPPTPDAGYILGLSIAALRPDGYRGNPGISRPSTLIAARDLYHDGEQEARERNPDRY